VKNLTLTSRVVGLSLGTQVLGPEGKRAWVWSGGQE